MASPAEPFPTQLHAFYKKNLIIYSLHRNTPTKMFSGPLCIAKGGRNIRLYPTAPLAAFATLCLLGVSDADGSG